jgi:hypothetical protein
MCRRQEGDPVSEYSSSDSLVQVARLPEFSGRRASPLFRDYEALLDTAVQVSSAGRSASGTSDTDYVVARLADRSEKELGAKKAHLPPDVRRLPPTVLGYLEADILGWVFGYEKYRFLSVVGPRGSGKSTLLHYIFRTVSKQCPSVARKFTVIADCSAGALELDELDVSLLVLQAAIVEICEISGLSAERQQELSRLAHEIRQTVSAADRYQARHAARRGLEDLVRELVRDSDGSDKAIIVVLDNLDHLNPDSVAEVLSFARFLSQLHSVCCVLSLRPFMMRTQLERDYGIGAFVWPSVQVSPPDLRHLIQRRLDAVLATHADTSRVIVHSSTGTSFEFPTLAALFGSITNFMFSASVQRLATEGLCGGDIRQSMRAVRSFLRSRVVPVEEFLSWHLLRSSWETTDVDSDFVTKRSESSFIEGAMLDDWEYYREEWPDKNNPVMNLFSLRGRSAGLPYSVIYRLLSVLEWSGDLVDIGTLRDILSRLGHDLVDVQSAIAKLMSFGLIMCPRTESSSLRTGELRITSSGLYYRQKLAGHSGYLFQVVPDVPLKHRWWGEEKSPVVCRVRSLMELAERLAAEEEMEHACLDERWNARGAEVLRFGGVLCRRVSDATAVLVNQMSRSERGTMKEKLAAIGLDFEQLVQGTIRPVESHREALLRGGKTASRRITAGASQRAASSTEVPLPSGGRAVLLLTPRRDMEGRPEVEVAVKLHRNSVLRDSPIAVLIEFDNAHLDDNQRGKVLAFMPHDRLDEQHFVVRGKGRKLDRIRGRMSVAGDGQLLGATHINS